MNLTGLKIKMVSIRVGLYMRSSLVESMFPYNIVVPCWENNAETNVQPTRISWLISENPLSSVGSRLPRGATQSNKRFSPAAWGAKAVGFSVALLTESFVVVVVVERESSEEFAED